MTQKDQQLAAGRSPEAGLERSDTYGVKDWKAGKQRRASIITHLFHNSFRLEPEKATWVTGLLFFKQGVDWNAMKEELSKRILAVPRFRSVMRIKRTPRTQTVFIELPPDQVDLDYHIRMDKEDEVLDEDALNKYMSSLGRNMDLDRPHWQFTFLPKLADGRAVLVTNINHAIGDGVSQLEVLFSLLDKPDLEKTDTAKSVRPPSRRKPPSLGVLRKTKAFMGGVYDGMFFAMFGASDKPNSLKLKDPLKPSPEKRIAFSESIELDRVKAIKNKLEFATLNDILVAVLTLAIKSYFEEAGEENVVRKQKVSAQFPINIRSKSAPVLKKGDPGNHFSYGFLKFPLKHEGSASSMVFKVKRTLDEMKNSPSPYIQPYMGGMVKNMMTLRQGNAQAINLACKSSMQLSNVAGPQTQASIAGQPIEDLQFCIYAPISQYIGIVSYNGKLSVSICTDSTLPDPNILARHWKSSFEALETEVMGYEKDIITRKESKKIPKLRLPEALDVEE